MRCLGTCSIELVKNVSGSSNSTEKRDGEHGCAADSSRNAPDACRVSMSVVAEQNNDSSNDQQTDAYGSKDDKGPKGHQELAHQG